GLKHLSALSKLETLILVSDRITDKGLKLIGRLPNLQTLHVSGFLADLRITDSGLRHLKSLKKLQTLWLFGQYSGRELNLLAGLPALRRLTLGDKLTDEGMQELRKLPQLESLELHGFSFGTKGLESIKRLSNLKKLGLEFTLVSNDWLRHL